MGPLVSEVRTRAVLIKSVRTKADCVFGVMIDQTFTFCTSKYLS